MNFRSFFSFNYSIQKLKAKMGPVTNLKIGDFNHDGLPDIYVASDSMTKKSNSYLLEGLDNGNFKLVTNCLRASRRDCSYARAGFRASDRDGCW